MKEDFPLDFAKSMARSVKLYPRYKTLAQFLPRNKKYKEDLEAHQMLADFQLFSLSSTAEEALTIYWARKLTKAQIDILEKINIRTKLWAKAYTVDTLLSLLSVEPKAMTNIAALAVKLSSPIDDLQDIGAMEDAEKLIIRVINA